MNSFEIADSVSLVVPGVRMVVIFGYVKGQAGDEFEFDTWVEPVVAIQSTCQRHFQGGKYDDSSPSDQGLAAEGSRLQYSEPRIDAVVVDDEMGLTTVCQMLEDSVGTVSTLVACPWPVGDDDRYLTKHINSVKQEAAKAYQRQEQRKAAKS